MTPLEARAAKYFFAKRPHWGVFVNGELVDMTFDERDAELRSCSLCECLDLTVIVREVMPYATMLGEQRAKVSDIHVTPSDPSQELPPPVMLGDVWSWKAFGK